MRRIAARMRLVVRSPGAKVAAEIIPIQSAEIDDGGKVLRLYAAPVFTGGDVAAIGISILSPEPRR